MAVLRNDPYSGQNFLIDLGDGQSDGPHGGFQEISGLETMLDIADYRTGNDRDVSPSKSAGLARVAHVTLRRGIIGSLDLYYWFDTARQGGKDALRTVRVTLLNEVREPVLGNVAMEELVLAYERLEME